MPLTGTPVVPEDGVLDIAADTDNPRDIESARGAGESSSRPASTTGARPLTPGRDVVGSVRSLVHSATTRIGLTRSPTNEPTRRRSHYRRGSILMRHLEEKKATGRATDKDLKFFETVKSHFESSLIESRTIISLSVFHTGANPLDDPFAVIHMPLEIQQGFRRKLFAIFTIQLFLVVLLICVFSYAPGVDTAFQRTFQTWYYIFAAFVAMVVSLVSLYLVKYRFPLNFAVLALYTVTQSVFFSGCDMRLAAPVSLFVFGYLLCVMAITTLFCTTVVARTRSIFQPPGPPPSEHKVDATQPAKSTTAATVDPAAASSTTSLVSYPAVLLLAFFIVLLTSLLLYFVYLQRVMSAVQYGASLAGMLLVVVWFAYDASCMNERLSPDEYMQGVVFFYTDMVLFIMFLSIIFVACFACEGDCSCYGTADIAPIGAGGEEDDEYVQSVGDDGYEMQSVRENDGVED